MTSGKAWCIYMSQELTRMTQLHSFYEPKEQVIVSQSFVKLYPGLEMGKFPSSNRASS